MFRARAEKYGDANMLRAKSNGKWRWFTWKEARKGVDDLASGLIALGVQHGDRVGLLSENRPEWAACDLSILTAGAVTVSIYLSLTPKQIEYLLSDSGAVAVIVSNVEQLSKVLEVRGSLPNLKHVLLIDGKPPEGEENVVTLCDLVDRGTEESAAERERRVAQTQPEDLASLIYTSGTTGEPKGVMLTHHNFLSNVEATTAALPPLGPDDWNLAFLPLSHVFGRVCDYYLMIQAGVPITYAQSWESLAQDLPEIRPTVMLAVPRFYEKVHSAISSSLGRGGAIRRAVARWGLKVAGAYSQVKRQGRSPSPWLGLKHAVADRLVLSTARAPLGGNIRFFVSGGAPLARQLAEFFCDIGSPVLEGYGLTETSPVTNVNRAEKVKPGTVGPTIPGVDMKIAEDGEILLRGPNIMKGYWNKPEATAEVLRDGWFYSGDIGHIDEDGYLVITDRKKDLIVTAGGKNVAPQLIENLLKQDPLITEAVVYGDKRKYLAALIVPDFAKLKDYARANNISFTAISDLIGLQEIQKVYQQRISERLADLAPFEQIRAFRILDHEFSQETGQLTPSLKVKRSVVYRRYADLLDAMYGSE